jgi:hypothetical protein
MCNQAEWLGSKRRDASGSSPKKQLVVQHDSEIRFIRWLCLVRYFHESRLSLGNFSLDHLFFTFILFFLSLSLDYYNDYIRNPHLQACPR